jgi:uncharacterized protein (TIGR02611 family)
MSEEPRPHGDELLVGATDDDWAWRRRLRSNPRTRALYRVLVALVGLVILSVGLLLVPAPGPGWVIVFVGLAVLASEFEWAQRLLHFARRTVEAWTDWVKARSLWVKGVLSLATLAFLLALAYGYLAWQGPPGVLPDAWEQWLRATLSL